VTDFSGLVALDADELGRPTGLKAMTADDTISSSVLTRNIRDVVTTVEDSSGTWEEGGAISTDVSSRWEDTFGVVSSTTDGSAYWISSYNYSLCAWDTVSATSGTWTGGGVSADGYENWNAALDTVSSTTDGSGFWVSAYNYSLCAWDTVSATSGAWTAGGDANVDTAVSGPWENTFENVRDTSSLRDRVLNYITDGSGYIGEVSSFVVDASTDLVNASGTFETFSGNMETSTAGLSSIVDAFSGNVETSVVTIDGNITTNTTNIGSIDSRVTTVESQVPSAVGYSDWDRTTAYVTDASTDLENASSTFETFSGNMETSTAGLSALVDGSTAILDTSTDALNVWSGSVDTSVVTIDGNITTNTTNIGSIDSRVTTVESQVPSAVGFSDWNRVTDYVTDASTDLENASSTFETFSGNMETSTAGLSSIVDTFSGNVETSVVTIDGDITTNTTNIGSIDSRVTTVESQVPSAVGFGDWNRVRDYVTDASTDLENASSTFETFSGNMETSTAGLSGIVDTFSGNVETSVVDLDTSTDALNVFSGSVEASTATLDAQVPSAPGFAGWDSTKTTVDAGASNWDTAYSTDLFPSAVGYANWDNAATWGDVSSTKCLGGTAPAATVSAITVSACPVPAPWIYVRQTNNEQSTADQTDFYFGGNAADAGTSPATTSYELSPELITWVPTYPEHILIAATGYYEVIFYGSFYLPAGSNNPTTITQQLQTSAMSIETTRISKVLQMRNNAEPTDAGLHWIGYLMAGDKLGIQITADATTNLREGSTFTCKRIN
jgi:hypothetical protein